MQNRTVCTHGFEQILRESAEHRALLRRVHLPLHWPVVTINHYLIECRTLVTAKNQRDDLQPLADTENRPILSEHILLVESVVEYLLRCLEVRMLFGPIDKSQSATSQEYTIDLRQQ